MPTQDGTVAKKSAQTDLQDYVWTGKGPINRRIDNQLRVYENGDKIKLTPRAAYLLRENLETVGGLKIPAHMFDGVTHPHVERKTPTSPEERAAKAVGEGVAGAKTSLAGVGASRKPRASSEPDDEQD